ncbi:cytochrome c oxidase assembly factor 4 homolog, mitochondrial [Synchiropus splendidus]|uniref:cytochrome c oxidase assembly factor 4 homolog, mitochondrial n=1 Tax=Synchiropus splendidus TaxID=270530 RepID=UPI00237E375B|nr:cytochrome c oxidase assembly factor 4 homolog, mitochondrial [Synchiropus splendidus]
MASHDRSRSEEQDDPLDRMISRTGCAQLHYALQECMAEQQDWRLCQSHVQAFKDCMSSFQKSRQQLIKQSESARHSDPAEQVSSRVET